MKKVNKSKSNSQLGLEGFRTNPQGQGLSLEELGSAYAELLSRGSTPYEESDAGAAAPHLSRTEVDISFDDPQTADIGCDVTPKSILEAILFVGNNQNLPLTSRMVAALMRGVRPQEIDALVNELNAEYRAEGSPYEIVSVAAGYLLQLREEFASLRDSFYGRVREATLTQSAVDVLAIVAYRQPITRQEVDEIRGKPSGGMLSQLLRRGLLRLDRAEDKTKLLQYRTTDRFLQLFGLENLAELPQSQDLLPEG